MSGSYRKILCQSLAVTVGGFALLFYPCAALSSAASFSAESSCSDLPCAIKAHDPGAVARAVAFDVAYSAASSPCTPIKDALHTSDGSDRKVIFLPWSPVNAGPDDDYSGLVFGNLIERPSWTIADYLNDGRRLLVVQDRGFAQTFMPPSGRAERRDWGNPRNYTGLTPFRVQYMGPCHVNDDPIATARHLVLGSKSLSGESCNKPREQLIHVPLEDKDAYPLLPEMHLWKIGLGFARTDGSVYTLYFSANYISAPAITEINKSLRIEVDVVKFSSENYRNVCVFLSRSTSSAKVSAHKEKDTR